MDANSNNPQPSIEATLALILARLEAIEGSLAMAPALQAPPAASAAATDTVLLLRLDRLTLKRHAVLTATLGKVGYQELADIMDCDPTTVKLHLKGAMNLLDIPNRSSLLANHPHILAAIPDRIYEGRYGLAKRWWLSPSPELMAVLQATKGASNQHTR